MNSVKQNEQLLKQRYLEFLLANRNLEHEPENANFISKKNKAEQSYYDVLVKSKIPQVRLNELIKEVEESFKYTNSYKESILEQLKNIDIVSESDYKEFYKSEILALINKDTSKESNKSVSERSKRQEEMKKFEEKHSFEEIFMLKKEVLREIRELELTPVQRERLDQIEKNLDEEKKLNDELMKERKRGANKQQINKEMER
ncbi:hypothetical protein [Ornithinibacillus sp. FSL M8-0202]|uniref:hypothetical protein n=1 Tax=Ornithinibacillus sp. FSL M8-0202 TaxID=2921616 RepID=UPI0030CDDA96